MNLLLKLFLFLMHLFECGFRNLFHEWTIELKGMADRIINMRQKLFDALRERGELHWFFVFNVPTT